MQRAREIREFILLPWDEKKKRATEYWQKYWRIYLFLFLFAAIIAFINVYIEWYSVETHGSPRSRISRQSGGVGPDDDKNKENQPVTEPAKNAPNAPNANNKVITETAAANNKTNEQSEKAAGNTTAAVNTKAAGDTTAAVNTKAAENTTAAVNTKAAGDTTAAVNTKAAGDTTAAANTKAAGNTTAAANTKAAGNTTTVIKQTNISNDNKTSTNIDNRGDSSSLKKSEIRERRLAKQSQRTTTSIADSLSGVGNTMSSALNGGVGKALSVIGIFFSAIVGLFLFCSAPVVIFYMWMKKLIMPLFPSRG